MYVSEKILKEIENDTDTERFKRGQLYQKTGKIRLYSVDYYDEGNFEITGKAYGQEIYTVKITAENGQIRSVGCDCQDFISNSRICKHIVGTILELDLEGIKSKKNVIPKYLENKNQKFNNFNEIVRTLYNEELSQLDNDRINIVNNGKIKIEPKLIYDKYYKELKLEFKIGNKRMYKLKNLSDFYERMLNKEFYSYGDKLEFVHTKEAFSKDSQDLLNFILKYSEIINFANSNANSSYRYYGKALDESGIIIGNSGIDELFEILKGKTIEISRGSGYSKDSIYFEDNNPDLYFNFVEESDDQYKIKANFDIYNVTIFKGKNFSYILDKNKLYRCTKEFENSNLKLFELFRSNYLTEVKLSKNELEKLFSVVIPKLGNAIKINDKTKEKIKKYEPEKLGVKVFLDFDENEYVIADVKLCYGENEFNPLDEEAEKNFKYSRNIIQETKALNTFQKSGFMYDVNNKRFILPDDDKIYEFLSNDINYYMEKFEVLATDNFKTKEIRTPKISSLGVKIENNLLEVNFNKLNIDSSEIEEIMKKYKLKKKYHRLKNGSFIELEDNPDVEFLDKLISDVDINYKNLEKGVIKLPVNRSLYLNELLKNVKGTEIVANKDYKDIINELDKDSIDDEETLPKSLERCIKTISKSWL